MVIRYGYSRTVRKPHRRKTVECRNGQIELEGLYDPSIETHIKIREAVRKAIPEGWCLSGWISV